MTDSDQPTSLQRRDFLKIGGIAAAASVTTGPLTAMAGPFDNRSSGHLIPSDKKLTAAWLQSLYERGEPDVFSGEQLQHVGMPIGGIACGQLYLGGVGRLWLWDFFRPSFSSGYGIMSM